MSSNKPPQNPFGGGERTVIIRPNPAGRSQPQPPAAPAPPPPGNDVWATGNPVPPGPPPRVAAYPRQPAHPSPPSYHPPQAYPPPPQSYQPAAPHRPQQSHGVPQPPARPGTGGSVMDLGFATHPDVGASNPIMQAARPLLVLLANFRLTADHSRVEPLMDAIADEIAQVEGRLGQAGVSPEHIHISKYALCATADDIVQHLPGSDRLLWAQYSMLSRFFGITTSGVGFFEELQRVKAQPVLNYDPLELMHACLSIGFQGQYRVAGGEVALQQVRRDLYQTLRAFKPRAPEDISPHWRGQEIKSPHFQRRLPVWVAGSAAAALLALVFIGLRILLGSPTDAMAERLDTLHPMSEVRIERDVFKPLPPVVLVESGQLERVRGRLAEDIKAERLIVDEARGKIVVKLRTDVMFAAGRDEVNEAYKGIIEHVAAALDPEPKEILIVGHTDKAKLRSRIRFKDNQDLSEKRASAVAAIMGPKLKDASRMQTSGRGPDSPLMPNNSEKNRALNRRVEIFLPRTGP
jgi:type VI secretion system protein ImpK